MNRIHLSLLALLPGLVLTLPLLTVHSHSAQAQSLQKATIVSIGDRNNLLVRQRGRTETVWLGCMDMPNPTQKTWGKLAADRLDQLLPIGQPIQIREISRDRYGSIIGEIFVNGESVNLQLVTEGMAALNPRYLGECRRTQVQYIEAEAEAQQQGIGLWQEPTPCMPWDHRQGRCN
jgi:micrococcal nuclease